MLKFDGFDWDVIHHEAIKIVFKSSERRIGLGSYASLTDKSFKISLM
jgi:hypothetical protein